MKFINGLNQQGDTEKACIEFYINSLPRGKKREEAKRRAKEQEMFDKFGIKIKYPNKRVEGQKKRRAREYEAKRQQRINQSLAKRLSKAWGVYYPTDPTERHELIHMTGKKRTEMFDKFNLNQEEK